MNTNKYNPLAEQLHELKEKERKLTETLVIRFVLVMLIAAWIIVPTVAYFAWYCVQNWK